MLRITVQVNARLPKPLGWLLTICTVAELHSIATVDGLLCIALGYLDAPSELRCACGHYTDPLELWVHVVAFRFHIERATSHRH